MAGFKKDEPRNRKGEWSNSALARGYGEGRGVKVTPPIVGRPKPDFKVAAENRGKPRTLYQHAKFSNPSAQTTKVRPSAEKLARRSTLMHTLEGKPFFTEGLDAAAAKKIKEQIKSGFSNLSPAADQKRLNRNLGQVPTGMRRANPNYEGKTAVKGLTPQTEYALTGKAKKIQASEEAHMAALKEYQRGQRSVRDALVEKIMAEPGDFYHYQIGNNPAQPIHRGSPGPFGLTGPAAARIGQKVVNVAEKAFNRLDKWWK